MYIYVQYSFLTSGNCHFIKKKKKKTKTQGNFGGKKEKEKRKSGKAENFLYSFVKWARRQCVCGGGEILKATLMTHAIKQRKSLVIVLLLCVFSFVYLFLHFVYVILYPTRWFITIHDVCILNVDAKVEFILFITFSSSLRMH